MCTDCGAIECMIDAVAKKALFKKGVVENKYHLTKMVALVTLINENGGPETNYELAIMADLHNIVKEAKYWKVQREDVQLVLDSVRTEFPAEKRFVRSSTGQVPVIPEVVANFYDLPLVQANSHTPLLEFLGNAGRVEPAVIKDRDTVFSWLR
jgi:hypothetical protein